MDTFVYDEMRDEAKRLVSFQQYPILYPEDAERTGYYSPLKLSNAGFFREPGASSDEVTCFACGIKYSEWSGESPMAVHRILNPDCQFLNEEGEEVELEERIPSTPNNSERMSGNPEVRRRLFDVSEEPGSSVHRDQQLALLPKYKPVYGDYNILFESHRLLTFSDPNNRQSEVWAENGFVFLQESGLVKCVFCGVEICFENEEPVIEIHRQVSENCPFVRYIDTGNITRELENSVKSKQMNLNTDVNTQRSVAYLHPQFEDEEVRKKTFEYWPCLPQTEEQLVEAGFYFTGCSDKVVCFACGYGLRKWKPSAVPWVEHARHSPDCQFVREKKGVEFIQQAAQTTEVLTVSDPPKEGPVSEEGQVHTVRLGKPHLDMSAIAAATECNYSIEQIREAILTFFFSSRGLYPNKTLLLGLLQAADKNFDMVRKKDEDLRKNREDLRKKDGALQSTFQQLQRKDGELQRKDGELQREREELQIKEIELQRKELEARAAQIKLHREQQTHLALAEGQAAVIRRHVQEIRNREQQYQQQLQQRDQLLQQRDQLLYIAHQQLDNQTEQLNNQTEQLNNRQQIQNNMTEMIRRLANELQRLGRDARDIPDDNSDDGSSTPPGVSRCKVCLSENANILFRPCRHICCGAQCAHRFVNEACPVCRTVVQEYELVFIS